jgi:hypothetical protein
MAGETKILLGSATTVISHAASLANNGYTYSGLSGCTMTDLDNSTTLYSHARATLHIPETFAAAPTAGGYFNLYLLPLNVDGTSDDTPAPDATALKAARWVGAFPISAYDVEQRVTIDLPGVLRGLTACQFFIENKCGQATTYSASALTVKVTPYTFQPAA